MKKIVLILLAAFCVLSAERLSAQNFSNAVALQLVYDNKDAIGFKDGAIENMAVSSSYIMTETGITMVYLQQTYKGIPVLNKMKVLAFKNGKLISNAGILVEDMVNATGSATELPALNGSEAVRRAFQEERLPVPSAVPVNKSADGRKVEFGKLAGSTEEVTAELLWFPVEDGHQFSVKLGWQVLVAPVGTDDVWQIRVDAVTGNIIDKANLVVHDDFSAPKNTDNTAAPVIRKSITTAATGIQNPINLVNEPESPSLVSSVNYNVIPYPYEAPSFTPAAIRNNPWTAAPGNATVFGWHSDGTTNYTISRGNNVWATEDTIGANLNTGLPATSSTSPDPLNFITPPNYNVEPSRNPAMQQFCITNLFYWNNIIHDITYQYGFNEVSGNFQANNNSQGGVGNDHVMALAQSGAAGHIGNNANFLTGVDGVRGRMRMYLFNAVSSTTLLVNTPPAIAGNYTAVEGVFSTNNLLVNVGPVTGQVVYYNDDAGGTTHLGCAAPANSVTGKIALIDRGTCNFTAKVLNAQTAGAIAVIMVNNVAGAPIPMGGTDNTITIPAVMISQSDGAIFAAQLANNVNVTLSAVQTQVLDGDLDNGVVTHEFGHGISNRLTGGPATASCLQNAEQGGEGWSDYFALMLTTNWATATTGDGTNPRPVGTYVIGQPTNGSGIRNFPYCTNLAVNPLTYANMGTGTIGTEVHNIGEIWCMALWEMTWAIIQQENNINTNLYNFSLAGNGGNSIALKLVMEGMRLQPCSPGYVDARNAILTADMNLYGGRHQCAIWTAFAKRGLGYSALQGSSFSAVDQTAATDLPPAPNITTQPVNVTVPAGSNTSFSVTATAPVNGAYLVYNWQVSTDGGVTYNDLAPAVTTATLNLTAVTAGMNGNRYRCVIKQGCATTNSTGAILTVSLPTGFTFSSPAPATAACPAPVTMDIVLGTTASGSFSNPITLTNSTPPAGTTVSYIPSNVVTPGNSVTVRLTGTNTLIAGSYVITITGTATGATTQTRDLTYTITPGSGPAITGQPANQTVCEGSSASFSITAATATSFQWQLSTDGGVTYANVPAAAPYGGTTSATLSISAATLAMNNNRYRCIASTLCGSTTSNAGILTVNAATAITVQPNSVSSCTGATAQFCVTAVGTNLVYQWQSAPLCAGPWVNLIVPSTNCLTLTGLTIGQNGTAYRCVVSGLCGTSVTTNCVTLSVATSLNITSQPTDVTLCGTANTSFTVAASGAGTYQWQISTDGGVTYNNVPAAAPYSGTTTATLSITGASPALSGNRYRCQLNSSCGNATSNGAILTVNALPAVSADPVSATACTGTNQTFSVTASGTGITYQWQISTDGGVTYSNVPAAAPYSGTTTANLTITGVTLGLNNNRYRCVVTGTCAPAITSAAATLTVLSAVSITGNPANQTICEGTNTSFTVSATGAGLVYQWQVSTDGGTTYTNLANGAVYGGVATTTLTLTNVPPSLNNNRYRCVVTNGSCTPGISSGAVLTVNTFPLISAAPQNVTICAGGNTTFSVIATTAVGVLSYQWQVSTDGGTTYTNIAGAITNSFAQTNIPATQNGYRFRVIVTAGCGSVTTAAAILTVNASPVVAFDPPYVVCVSDVAFTLTASPAGGAFSGPGVSGATFTPSIAGLGQKAVLYSAANAGCVTTVSRTITVNECNDRHLTLEQFPAVVIYPSPNNGHFNIRINTDLYTVLGMKVYNSLGQMVNSQSFSGIGYGSVIPVDLSHVPSGTYHLFLYNDERGGNPSKKGASVIIFKE